MGKAADIYKDLVKKKLDVSMLSNEDSPCVVSEWLSTGCLVLDRIMGGGLPVGRLVEIYGDQATGKSLIASQVAAEAQRQNHVVAYADTETAVSLEIMRAVGVDVDNLIYAAPDTIEEVFTFFESCIVSKRERYPNDLMVIIWDSVAGTSAEREMESEYGKAMMGRHANLISQAMRKMIRQISKDRVCALFLNQTRQKIGVMFGDSTTTFGGKALGFFSSVRIQLKLADVIRIPGKNPKKKKAIGVHARAIVTKNKVAWPFMEATLPIYFGFGIDDAEATLTYLLDNGVVADKGGFITIGADKIRKSKWGDYYEQNYDVISDLVKEDE